MDFRKKPWSAKGLDKFIKKIDDTGGTDRTIMIVVDLNY